MHLDKLPWSGILPTRPKESSTNLANDVIAFSYGIQFLYYLTGGNRCKP